MLPATFSLVASLSPYRMVSFPIHYNERQAGRRINQQVKQVAKRL